MRIPITMMGGALAALWLGGYLLHLMPLEKDLTWWQIPWLLTVLFGSTTLCMGVALYLLYLWDHHVER